MAAVTFVQTGDAIDYTNPTENDIEAGTPILVGRMLGITHRKIPAGATGALHFGGVYDVDAALILSGPSQYSIGDLLFWNGFELTNVEDEYGASHGMVVGVDIPSDSLRVKLFTRPSNADFVEEII